MTSSFVDLTHVGSGKANGISDANIHEARRQFSKGVINSAKADQNHRRDMENAWRMASTPYNPWGITLNNSIRFNPNEIYTDTLIAVTGFQGGSTLYIEAGKLHEAGMSIDQIMSGVTAEDIHDLLTRGTLELDLTRH